MDFNKFLSKALDALERKGDWPEVGELNPFDAENPEQLVITADWNNKGTEKIAQFLDSISDKNNLVLGFSDEYTRCAEDFCDYWIDIQPNSWGWIPNYIIVPEIGYICRDCVEQKFEEYLECFINNPKKAFESWCVPLLEKEGFECYGDNKGSYNYETGFYEGQRSDPEEEAKYLEHDHPELEFVFVINARGQFDVHWSIFTREKKEV